MKKLFLLLIAVCSIALGAEAQKVIRGQVIEASSGEPLVGATVQPVGGGNGTSTDANGQFSVSVTSGVKTLRVSYVGYLTKDVPATNGVVAKLDADENSLDEVIVVAYGQTKKTSFTGSAEAITNKKLELRPITSATKALEGNVSGVQLTNASGQPGSSPSIRVRGYGSINASSSPLYVLDGIPYDGSLASINPADIESMTVLKDASATALYGARGANGVVMIQTKKGVEGKPTVTWRSTVGWSNRAGKKYDNVNQKEFVQLVYEALRNGNVFSNGMSWADAEAAARAQLSGNLGGEGYNPFKNYTWATIIDPATGQVQADAQSAWDENWYDEIQNKNALRHEHQLSVAGGTAKTKYLVSLGYLNEDGILKHTDFQRYSGRVNVDTQVTDWFKLNSGINVAHSKTNYLSATGSATSNVWYSSQFINPLLPMYLKNADGTDALDASGNRQYDWGEAGSNRPGSLSDYNPLGMLALDKDKIMRDAAGMRAGIVLGSDKESWGWAQGLKLAVNFGFDYNNDEQDNYMNSKHGNQASAGGLLEKYNTRTQSYTFNQLVTWTRTFNKVHNFDVLLGHEFYAYNYRYLLAGKTNLVEGILELRPGTTIIEADSYHLDYRVNSFLSRFNYNYDNRYYFSASLRSDASSRFYKENHTGTFWSVGANWRISSEKFMKDVKWVNNLSFKISYGEQGNDDILNSDGTSNYYLWQSLYDLGYPNGTQKGAIISSLENKDISWEKNGNFNTGIEALLFDQRVKLSLEYYNRKTTDMLLSYPMALSTGFSGYNANVGDMRNRGWKSSWV